MAGICVRVRLIQSAWEGVVRMVQMVGAETEAEGAYLLYVTDAESLRQRPAGAIITQIQLSEPICCSSSPRQEAMEGAGSAATATL